MQKSSPEAVNTQVSELSPSKIHDREPSRVHEAAGRRATEPPLDSASPATVKGAPACGLHVACFASTGPCLMILPGKIGAYRKDEGEAGPTLARPWHPR